MTWMLLTGCGLVAFGPSLVLSTTVLTHANLTAIALSAALFWITSLLATAIIWTFLPLSPSFLNIVVVLGGSVVQEVVRVLFVRAYRRVHRTVKELEAKLGPGEPGLNLTNTTSAMAAGFGFGTVHATLLYGSVLTASGGEGIYFAHSCPDVPVVVYSAGLALLFYVIDMALMFVAFSPRFNASRDLLGCIALHCAAAAMTLLGEFRATCSTVLCLDFLIAAYACVVAYSTYNFGSTQWLSIDFRGRWRTSDDGGVYSPVHVPATFKA